MLTVKIERLSKEVSLPSSAHEGDAFDLYAAEDVVIKSKQWAKVSCGFRMEPEPHVFAWISPRSGLALEYGLTVLNSPGTIDPGYRGEVCVIIMNHGDADFVVEKGFRIAQMTFLTKFPVRLIEARVQKTTARAEKGFGSTGT